MMAMTTDETMSLIPTAASRKRLSPTSMTKQPRLHAGDTNDPFAQTFVSGTF
jgi:hypothetical protein